MKIKLNNLNGSLKQFKLKTIKFKQKNSDETEAWIIRTI